ncbi:MAG: hypothetical protein FWE67_14785 [Planctomycetaceae bacterium]|nr:hypothetical protein [Planctomycetaceae bacterium]
MSSVAPPTPDIKFCPSRYALKPSFVKVLCIFAGVGILVAAEPKRRSSVGFSKQ